ncbi:hypothetical protein LCGC14_1293020 [marine sediment metagenome]|uniref:Heme NO-binding domain-containing protein n=1 Tax=marine sediment metagenome TaxID=412755 RepID=A0A0F9KS30_9ZZZZ
MKTKGIAFLQYKAQLTHVFGEERWNDFFEMLKTSNPYFTQAILATTQVPVDEFISFIDAMVKEYYNGDEKIIWRFGRQVAKYSLSEKGPFYAFIRSKREPEAFISKILHRIWSMYYDEGRAKNELEGNIMHAYILDLPKYYRYIEYSVMGFIQQAIELIGVLVKETVKVKSSAREIHYKFVLEL